MPNLLPFQSHDVPILQSLKRALVFWDMGLGKTVLALSAAGSRVLVVAPPSALGVWKSHAAVWRPDLTVRTTHGRGNLLYPREGELVLCTPHRLGAWHPMAGFDLIFDECQSLRKASAAITRHARNLANAVRLGGGRTWLLSGTPLEHRPDDLKGLLVLAGLLQAFGGEETFNRLFGYQERPRGHAWGVPHPEAAARLRPFVLRRTRADVQHDLPPRRHRELCVPLSTRTARLCDDALLAIHARGLTLEGSIHLSQLNRLPRFNEVSRARSALATAKIPALLDLVERYETAGEPLVVASSHRTPLDAIALRPGWRSITGDTSPRQRTLACAAFQAGELKGIAISEAGGVAITLTRASDMVVVSDPWSPAMLEQMESRIHRTGQHRPVLITRLTSTHPLERRVEVLHAEKSLVIRESVGRI